jgi:hypothetical protein
LSIQKRTAAKHAVAFAKECVKIKSMTTLICTLICRNAHLGFLYNRRRAVNFLRRCAPVMERGSPLPLWMYKK